MTEITNYFPDPGGVFPTDAHRRVASHLPRPDAAELNEVHKLDPPEPVSYTLLQLLERLSPDPDTPFRYGLFDGALIDDSESLKAVLDQLIDDGLVVVEQAPEQFGAEGDPVIDYFALTPASYEKLQAPIANEPPPLGGPRLEAAEKHNAELAEEETKDLVEAHERRVQIMREDLKAAEVEAAEVTEEEEGS